MQPWNGQLSTHTAVQVEICLEQLQDSGDNPLVVVTSLEALARLAWSDDDVRDDVADLRGDLPGC